jgi:hypothetical protein
MGKKICVTGRIKSCHGTLEIVAYGPDRIQLPAHRFFYCGSEKRPTCFSR